MHLIGVKQRSWMKKLPGVRTLRGHLPIRRSPRRRSGRERRAVAWLEEDELLSALPLGPLRASMYMSNSP
jgi:hypothetical protein